MDVHFTYRIDAGQVDVEGYAGDGEQEIVAVTLGGEDYYRRLTTEEAEGILERIAEVAAEDKQADASSAQWDRGYDRAEVLAGEVAR